LPAKWFHPEENFRADNIRRKGKTKGKIHALAVEDSYSRNGFGLVPPPKDILLELICSLIIPKKNPKSPGMKPNPRPPHSPIIIQSTLIGNRPGEAPDPPCSSKNIFCVCLWAEETFLWERDCDL